MSTTTKKTTTIYGVHASNDEKSKSLKAACTTEKLAKEHSDQPKEINNEKETQKCQTTRNLCCLEGFLYGNHD
ncbi:MAG: hypothetical protein IKN65_03490 [Clostridia bacterium]|nr:hypothetical protein [Clostridia bacterium]